MQPNLRRPLSHNTRLLLLAGFGGLLLLMAFAGLDAMRVLRTIQNRNDAIRREFLARNRFLNQIRSDLYLSGTYVRDYLLEPEMEKAESHRTSLENARRDMESALQSYATLKNINQRKPFGTLEEELTQYWRVLQPVMLWDARERQARGYAFLRDEVYPRRTAMLNLADEIGEVNEHQLNAGDIQVADLFSGFRIRLSLTLLVTLGLGAILAGFSMVRVLHLEQESAARFEETAQARHELKALSARLVETQESERRAVSRELHDEVGQSLSALLVGLSNLAAAIPAAHVSELEGQVANLRKLAESSVGVVRNMTLLLRPSMLDDLGLVPALQWQAREISKRSGMIVNFAAEGVADELPDEYKTAIYRVMQEALHNCEKHSNAKVARVTVRQQRYALSMSIQDDGCGFGPLIEKGLGLRGMQERIENLGGNFSVDSEAGRGTLIMVMLPFDGGTHRQAENGYERDQDSAR
ncbi:MAG: histidine kinase [Bryobacteraceae bacterium]